MEQAHPRAEDGMGAWEVAVLRTARHGSWPSWVRLRTRAEGCDYERTEERRRRK